MDNNNGQGGNNQQQFPPTQSYGGQQYPPVQPYGTQQPNNAQQSYGGQPYNPEQPYGAQQAYSHQQSYSGQQPYGYGTNPAQQAKKKNALIIGITAGICVIVAVTIILVAVLGGGKKGESTTALAGNTEQTSEITTTPETTAEDTEVDTEETEEESTEEDTQEDTEEEKTTEKKTTEATTEKAKELPFAEAKKFSFVDPYKGMGTPTFCWFETDDGYKKSLEGAEINSLDGFTHVKNITKSEPDKNGNVTYTVTSEFTQKYQYIKHPSVDWEHSIVRIPRFYVCDYYTGKCFEMPGIDNADGYFAEEAVSTAKIDGKKITVKISRKDMQWSSDKYEKVDTLENGCEVYEAKSVDIFITRITAPEDYDGLVLYAYKNGETYEHYMAEKQYNDTLFNVLGPDNKGSKYKASDLYFIRLNDYVKETVKRDFAFEKGIDITPNGSWVSFETSVVDDESQDTGDRLTIPVSCTVTETTDNVPDGHKVVKGYFQYDTSNIEEGTSIKIWNDVFDRYTGVSFSTGSEFVDGEDGISQMKEPIKLKGAPGEPDVYMYHKYEHIDRNTYVRELNVVCPIDYDGCVFMTGFESRAQMLELKDVKEEYKTRTETIDNLPFYKSNERYYYFTAEGK